MNKYSDMTQENQPNQGRLAWSTRAEALAEWAMATMVARTDTFGLYLQDGTPTRAKSYGVPTPLTTHALVEHFRGKQCVGLYSCDPTDMVKVVALDIDNHKDDEPTRSSNHRRLLAILARLKALGMRFLAYTSGKPGGYHVQVPFTEKLPYPLARAFGSWLADLQGKDFEPEVFPKRAVAHTAQKCGNYIRLLMPKPNRPIWPKVITGAEVLEGERAVEHVLGVAGNDPALIPDEARAFAVPLPRAVRERMEGPAGPRPDWASVATRYKGDLRTLDIVALADEAGWAPTDQGGGWFKVLCPWWADHTTSPDAYVIENEGRYPGFYCHHAHCEGRTVLDVLATFPPEKVDAHCGKLWDEARAEKERAQAKLDDIFKNRIDIDELPVADDNLGDPGTKTNDPTDSCKTSEPKRTLRGYNLMQLKTRPVPSWLVQAHFPTNSVCQIYGEAGHGKSFVALDIALSVASGRDFLGTFPVKQGPVLYLVGEGTGSLRYRIEAWLKHNKERDPGDNYRFVPDAFDLSKNLANIDEVVRLDLGRPPLLIVIDTLARYYGPGDENSQKDMNAFVAAVDSLRQRYGCTVLVVHHAGKNPAQKDRGSSVFRGACDTIFKVEAAADRSSSLLKCDKQKDADHTIDRVLCKQVVVVEQGEDKEETSCVFTPLDGFAERFELLSDFRKNLLADLFAAYRSATFKQKDWATRAGKDRRTVSDQFKPLVERGFLQKADGDKVRLSLHTVRHFEEGEAGQAFRSN